VVTYKNRRWTSHPEKSRPHLLIEVNATLTDRLFMLTCVLVSLCRTFSEVNALPKEEFIACLSEVEAITFYAFNESGFGSMQQVTFVNFRRNVTAEPL
jgi:hypothetical protein